MKEISLKVSLARTAFKNEARFAEEKKNVKTDVVSTSNVAGNSFFVAAANLVASILDEIDEVEGRLMSFTHLILKIHNRCREIRTRIWSSESTA